MAGGKSNMSEQDVNIAKETGGFIVYLLFLVIVIWAILTFVGQRTVVSGSSMYDTLEDGDNLWIDKFTYHFEEPKRFDIVVFPYRDSSVYYIKRIIGLPGEKIRIDDEGNIYVNGTPLNDEFGYEPIEPGMVGRANKDIFLGDNEYFVLGDNRNDSKDSRFAEVGNIRRDQIEGKAAFRIWPLSKFGKIK